MKKYIVLFGFTFLLQGFQPPVKKIRPIVIELEEARQRVHEAVSDLDAFEETLKKNGTQNTAAAQTILMRKRRVVRNAQNSLNRIQQKAMSLKNPPDEV
ncbi:MAG: hypothetical protein AB7R69_04135 [Candidatus Babeliales bacterium]